MTTWYGHWPLSHPWMPSLKRKHSSDVDSGSGSGSTSSSDFDDAFAPRNATVHASGTPQSKRRRYDLAHNLSHLSLFEQANAEHLFQTTASPSVGQDVSISPWPSAPLHEAPADAMDADVDIPLLEVVHPIIEEPVVPEVRMHKSSSYEPEKDRIVITDLDSSEDEVDSPPHTPAGNDAPYSVSPAFLARIRASKVPATLMKPISSSSESDPSRALVLFTPSPWSAKDSHELDGLYRARDNDKSIFDSVATDASDGDIDAMEVE